MELSSDNITVNGHKVSARRANTIMFVQCTMMGKHYKIDLETDPAIVAVIIEDYNPSEEELLPDNDDRPLQTSEGVVMRNDDRPVYVKKCKSCEEKKR